MNRKTLRSLLAVTVLFDLALLGMLLYDYLQNDSDWAVYVLVAFAVFLVRPEDAAAVQRVVRRDAVPEAPAPVRELAPLEPTKAGSIPPAPIRALRENPPRRIPSPPRPAASGIPFVYNGYTLFTKEV